LAVSLGVVLGVGGGAIVGVRTLTDSLRRIDSYRAEAARLSADLDTLGQRYDDLAERYDDAVRRTAVTELVVEEDGSLAVVIRDAAGELKRIETPFDPSAEIYVDYAVLDGRLWIRRVFDSYTPPGSAVVIDPVIGTIDWDQRPTGLGKAVYRSLTPGRWVITVTGNGSLGLARAADGDPVELTPQPAVRPYESVADADRAPGH